MPTKDRTLILVGSAIPSQDAYFQKWLRLDEENPLLSSAATTRRHLHLVSCSLWRRSNSQLWHPALLLPSRCHHTTVLRLRTLNYYILVPATSLLPQSAIHKHTLPQLPRPCRLCKARGTSPTTARTRLDSHGSHRREPCRPTVLSTLGSFSILMSTRKKEQSMCIRLMIDEMSAGR